MESGEPQMSDEMQTAEVSAEAPVTETDYTAEMTREYERLNPEDGLSRVPNEAQAAASHDYSVAETPETESTEPPEQPTDGIRAPASLSPTMREQWGATPREMQQWIAEREAQTQQKISEQGRQLSELQRGPQATMPHLEHVARVAQEHGLTPDATLQHWAAADRFIKENPEGAIRYLAQAHGVDLGQFADDPQLQQAREMQAQQIEMMRVEQAQWHQQREQQEQHLTAAINRFAEGKPYWPQIESQVVQQLFAMKMADPGRVQADPMGALKEAEGLAINLSGIELPERKAEAKKKADEAKRLASLNVRSSSSSPNIKFTSMEEEMTSVYERLHGRH